MSHTSIDGNEADGVCSMIQVVIHERDPHWEEARKLTTGAEQASKVSAAKVFPFPPLAFSLQLWSHTGV